MLRACVGKAHARAQHTKQAHAELMPLLFRPGKHNFVAVERDGPDQEHHLY
jgi:hypothetical protein